MPYCERHKKFYTGTCIECLKNGSKGKMVTMGNVISLRASEVQNSPSAIYINISPKINLDLPSQIDLRVDLKQALGELEELKKSHEKIKESIEESKSVEERKELMRSFLERTIKIALLSARVDDKPELLNALEELRFFAKENSKDLQGAISNVELMIKEGISVNEEFLERLRALLLRIEREYGLCDSRDN